MRYSYDNIGHNQFYTDIYTSGNYNNSTDEKTCILIYNIYYLRRMPADFM